MRLLVLFVLLSWPCLAQTSEWERLDRTYVQEAALPQPDKVGEFSRSQIGTHPFWEVVAEGGLKARLGQGDTSKVNSWPAVGLFPRGMVLTAYRGPDGQTGLLAVFDQDGKSWLRVLHPSPAGYCYVRAHSDYLRPVRVLEK